MMCIKDNAESHLKSQITAFHDQNPAYDCHIVSEEDPSRGTSDTNDVSLGEFFARPIEIKSVEWTPGGDLDLNFSPWGEWAANPRVANRLSNFRNFRGQLCVKILLNGNQFYWGRALLSYLPLPLWATRTTEVGIIDTISASQRPHLWIDPASSMGGVMKLPFYYPNDAIDITEADVAFAFNKMGDLWLTNITSLFHASGSDPITITFFAWCENVTLSAPTQSNMGSLSPQAGEISVGSGQAGAEYGKGPISKPATFVKSVADALQTVPVIRPFATATSIVAGAIGSLATMFGYSRPHVLEGIRRRKIWNAGNVANCDAEDTCDSLALTSKQEVSIDPRIVGLSDADELTIKNIAGTECWFDFVDWKKEDNPHQILVSLPVTPQMWRVGAKKIPPSKEGIAHTPMSYCCIPFRLWKGTINYRFQVIASGYHKGRLLFVWDPVTSHDVPEMNTVHSRVIDIAEQRDFTISIGWGSNRPMLLVRDPVNADTMANRTKYAGNANYQNGVLTCYVLNKLVSSSPDTNAIFLNVIVSCDDLEVANPNSRVRLYTPIPTPTLVPDDDTLDPQAGILSDANTSGEVNAPEDVEQIEDMGNTNPTDYLPHVCTGERVASFRQLLKRYCYSDSIHAKDNGKADAVFRFRHQRAIEPLFRGYTTKGIHVHPTNGEKMNACALTMMAFVSGMFHGWRGGIRYKLVPTGTSFFKPSRVYITRKPAGYSNDDTGQYVATQDNLTFLGVNDQDGWAGSLISTDRKSVV